MTTDGGGAVRPWLDGWLAAHGPELVALRRHLHAHPELSWEEHATTELLAERLAVAGLTPRRLSSGTGLTCDVPLGAAGEIPGVVLLRADIDALPMDDEKDVPYRSQVAGVSHSCGHDVHATVVLGAGLALHALALERGGAGVGAGAVRLVFQPAEERVPGGALVAIGDGALDGVTAALGLHCEPKLEAGTVGLRSGPITSAADMVTIDLEGPGGHTARPELTVDLVRVAAEVALRLPGALAAEPGGAGLRLVFGALQAGQAGNVVPAHARLRGTLRTADRTAWERAPEAVAHALDVVVAGTGAEARLDHTRGIPPVVNEPSTVATMRRAVRQVVGPEAAVDAAQSGGGDDFAWYAERVPSCYARLGVRSPVAEGPPLDLHAGHFDVDESAIAVGIQALVAGALAQLSSGASETSSQSPRKSFRV